MNVYLPIAEISVNFFLLLGLGGLTGIVSGMFGVGGGFLLTPMLMFIGVPPAVAVSTAANQTVATSISGVMSHWRYGNVDVKMAYYLLAGGMAGSTLGVALFRWLMRLGQIDVIVPALYVLLLTFIGITMAAECLRSVRGTPKKIAPIDVVPLASRLPWRVYFPKSKLYISALMPVSIGAVVGILVSLMGVGGGFFLIPAMIYLLGMPTTMVIGTSLFQIMCITAYVTLLQSITTQTVDVLLALLLLLGSVLGAQAGSNLAHRIRSEYLRGLLAVVVLAVALKLALDLFTPPANIYSVGLMDE